MSTWIRHDLNSIINNTIHFNNNFQNFIIAQTKNQQIRVGISRESAMININVKKNKNDVFRVMDEDEKVVKKEE